ncbi:MULTISPECIES: recombinase family protein [unclassified Streptomyces]|uniref:recombinase family protein n=1 Tax=unclassified Streptomyces TaxID=2593676 RepID=UPI0035DE1244
MSERVGYAICSLDEQDLTAQREIRLGPDVPEDRISLDHGLTGTNRERPGPAQALAAVRAGDTLTARQPSHLVRQHQCGEHTIADLAELFSVSRTTVCRVLERHQNASAPSTSGGQ